MHYDHVKTVYQTMLFINQIEPITNFTNSKVMYKLLVKQKLQDTTPSEEPFTPFIDQNLYLPANSILKRKLIDISEIKFREFNFKIIHNILPCNDN